MNEEHEGRESESLSHAEEPLGAAISWSDPHSSLSPYFLSGSQVCAILLLTVSFAFYSVLPLWHTDFWGHLNFGQWILKQQTLPDREPFSPYSDEDKPYINFQWVTQATYAAVFSAGETFGGGSTVQRMAGGVEMIRFTHATLVLSLLILLLVGYRRRSESLPLACVGVLIYLILGLGTLAHVRPQTVGQFCFVCMLWPLSRTCLSLRATFLLPVLFIFWANSHGSFLVGLLFILVWSIGQRIDISCTKGFLTGLKFWKDVHARRLVGAWCFAVVGIAILNPHGPKLFSELIALSRNPNIQTLSEWQPLTFDLGPGGHWGYGVTILLLLLTQLFSSRPFSLAELALIATFGIFPLLQQRMYIWWLFLVPWLFLPSWKVVGENLSWRWVHYKSTPSFTKTLFSVVIVLLVLLVFTPLGRIIRRRPPTLANGLSAGTPWKIALQLQSSATARPQWVPQLANALKEYYPNGRFTGRVFASETLGDYLIWALPPEHSPPVYTHVHLFPAKHWQDCMAVKFASPSWWMLLDRWRINLVLVETPVHQQLVEELQKDPAWVVMLAEGEEVKSDSQSQILLALRKTPFLP